MDKRKLGNVKQVKSFYELEFTSGKETGKHCILVHNEKMEVLFNKDNALDISYVRYGGNNISFLSKNGLNDGIREFAGNFEGGFLYTVGLDNISNCVEGKPVHGSLHYTKAENVTISEKEDYIIVSGIIRLSGLFLSNIILRRNYKIYSDKIIIDDIVENAGFNKGKYVLLYHTNYGYPFLDECLELDIPAVEIIPLTKIAESRLNECRKITKPLDNNIEDVFYNKLSTGNISLKNRNINLEIDMKYDIDVFPYTLEWKSMISGDYALGIEPSVTRFDELKFREISVGESKNYSIEIDFIELN